MGVGGVLIIINMSVARLIGTNYHHLLLHKDKRINFIQDIINSIRQIKYLNWESILIKKVQEIRLKEF
jgi:hypothetical protein